MAYRQALGRFWSVNGQRVYQKFPGLDTTTWEHGHPIGILFHYTAVCAPVFGAGKIGAQFVVGRNGAIYQAASAKTATWHAYGASHYWIGIEHEALPGHCELTDVQLAASAKLSAALVAYMKSTWNQVVPLTHYARPNYEAGFKDHKDGTASTWNADGHVDHLYHWTWDRYLGAIKALLNPAPPPPPVIEQHWQLTDETGMLHGPFDEAHAEAAATALMKALQVKHGADPDTAPDQIISVVRKAAPIP